MSANEVAVLEMLLGVQHGTLEAVSALSKVVPFAVVLNDGTILLIATIGFGSATSKMAAYNRTKRYSRKQTLFHSLLDASMSAARFMAGIALGCLLFLWQYRSLLSTHNTSPLEFLSQVPTSLLGSLSAPRAMISSVENIGTMSQVNLLDQKGNGLKEQDSHR
jgi:hypothetical protein